MSSEQGHLSTEHHPNLTHTDSPLTARPTARDAALTPISAPSEILHNPQIHSRGNGAVIQRIALQLQHTHGNLATQRALGLAPVPAQRSRGTPVPIQRFKLAAPTNVVAKIKQIRDAQNLTLSDSEAQSVAKELPNWFRQSKQKALKDHDFQSDAEFAELIRDAMARIDQATDTEGQALVDFLNTVTTPEVRIGYHGAGQPKSGQKVPPGFGDPDSLPTQIGKGYYITPSIDHAREYARQSMSQGMDGVVEEVYLSMTKIKDTFKVKGVSVREWWNHYKAENNEEYDMVVAAVAGKSGGTTPTVQYKVNPKHGKESGLLRIQRIETITE